MVQKFLYGVPENGRVEWCLMDEKHQTFGTSSFQFLSSGIAFMQGSGISCEQVPNVDLRRRFHSSQTHLIPRSTKRNQGVTEHRPDRVI